MSQEQPIPQGTISVIDISGRQAVLSGLIKGVGCPEGLAVSRDGRRLYVASQCACGHDPLFVIDTATDKVIASVPNLEVGGALVITPDSRRLYVGRANQGFSLIGLDEKQPRILKTFQMEPFQTAPSLMTISPDGGCLQAHSVPSGGRSVRSYDWACHRAG